MKKNTFIILLLLLLISPFPVEAKRGCCSHHGGVAGCNSSGRQVCNDGTLSPSCTCTPAYVYGCTDKSAKNYNSKANKNDGSCTYYVMGCTDPNSINYDSKAEKDNGSCLKKIPGCMDKTALNYNKSANVSDNSCQYKEETETPISTKSEEYAVSRNAENGSKPIDALTESVVVVVIGVSIYFVSKKLKKNRK